MAENLPPDAQQRDPLLRDDVYWSRLFSLPAALDTDTAASSFHDHATTLWEPLNACLAQAGQ